jgi:hypothetical protein
MATPESGDAFSVVLDTVLRSTQVTEFLVSSPSYSLTTGANYKFKVVAYNFNGPSSDSPISEFRVCGDPSGMAQPFRVSATVTTPSITVGWQEPTSNGGCPILGYIVYVDDGAGGSFVEANSDNDILVRS